MNRFLKPLLPGLLAVLLLVLMAGPSNAKVFKWQDSSGAKQDLFLLGFSEITMHFLDISGNVDAFEAANPDFKKDFTSNYRMSLFANGDAMKDFTINGAVIVDSHIDDEYRTNDPSVFRLRMSVESREPLWDGWRFTGNGLYDPNRQWELENLDTRLLTQPQEPAKLELLMQLASDKYGLIQGGSLRPSFTNSKFTLHQRSLFGAYADLHTENNRIGAEAVGGKLEGKAFREGASLGVRADGTTGPFDLSNAPVTRGSDEVKIETRDRFEESTVLSSRTLIRDIDYTVDYLRGRILLHQPIASETISGDPVFVVITYDYLRDENDELLGGRVKMSPADGMQVSGSYLKRYIDNDATGAGVDEPEDLVAADMAFQIKDHTTGYAEIAGSDNPNDGDSYTAIRAGVTTEAIDNLRLNVDFQEIDDTFRSFTNSDLNPNKNQQRINAGGKFDISEKQNIGASFTSIRGLEKNGQYNTYDGLLNQEIYAAGYRNDMAESFGFGLNFERRDKKDRSNEAHENNYQNRAIADVGGIFKDFGFFGDFGYDAKYELIMFRNDISLGDNDANTNQMSLTLTSKPTDNASIKVGQRFTLRRDKVLETYDDRQDASFATVQVKAHENLNLLTTGEYKRYTVPGSSVSFWQDYPTQIQWSATFATEYLPLEKVKLFGKVGRHDVQNWPADSTTRVTSDFVQGQITYFFTHHLSAGMENEYRREAQYYSVLSRNKTWDFGFKVNWNKDRLNEFTAGIIRRWQMQDYPPTTDVTSTSYIALLSGSVSLTRHFFARGSIKEILLNDPLDDEKTFSRVELGFDSQDWYRVSLGYERIESDTNDFTNRNYTGQGVFVRFSGKM